MDTPKEINKEDIIHNYLSLINSNHICVVLTNKYKQNSALAKNNHIFLITVTADSIEYIKSTDHFKNKMKYIINSDTLLYRDMPVDQEDKKRFFNTLQNIYNEVSLNKTWMIKNKQQEK